MNHPIILDAGPLVALLNKREKRHLQIAKLMTTLKPPFFTAEPVLTEASFLLRQLNEGAQTVLGMVRDGLIRVGLALGPEAAALQALMTKYSDVPMSLADACLVRLVEMNKNAVVLTFDSDFGVYRTNRKQPLKLLEME